MGKPREPKYKLSTMRIMWGALSGMMFLQAFMNLVLVDKPILGVLQVLLGILTGWYAINPPARIRKNFIQ